MQVICPLSIHQHQHPIKWGPVGRRSASDIHWLLDGSSDRTPTFAEIINISTLKPQIIPHITTSSTYRQEIIRIVAEVFAEITGLLSGFIRKAFPLYRHIIWPRTRRPRQVKHPLQLVLLRGAGKQRPSLYQLCNYTGSTPNIQGTRIRLVEEHLGRTIPQRHHNRSQFHLKVVCLGQTKVGEL